MNLFEKLSCISAEITNVEKKLKVGEGKSSYKAVGEADVLAAVKPLENKYKVYSYPSGRQIVDTQIMTVTTTYNGQTKETQKLFMRVETTYRFVNIEKPDEYIEITTYGDGVDSQDKAPGKAMTYADKYALLKAYKIVTGDDPDAEKSEDGTFSRMPRQTEPDVDMEKIKELSDKITKTAKALLDGGYDKEKFYEVVESTCGRKNFKAVRDVAVLEKLLKKVEAMGE